MSDTNTNSDPVYFGPQDSLFGWLHSNQTKPSLMPVIICPPVGFELVRTYRAVRTLSNELAQAGHTTLRFDYAASGDSHEIEEDANEVSAWLDSIQSAIEYLKSQTSSSTVALVGIRLGGTLAARAAELTALNGLVLWEPAESGKLFCREMQITAAGSTTAQSAASKPGIDAAGFFLKAQTVEHLKGIALDGSALLDSPPVLLLERDDIPVNQRRAALLDGSGSAPERQSISDYKAMMLAPQKAKVPTRTIERICTWLAALSEQNAIDQSSWSKPTPQTANQTTQISPGIGEEAIQFGPENRLFGILTHGADRNRSRMPAVILLGGGSVPHYSANRMYVPLARRIAARGCDVLRMSLSGVGDSDASPGGPIGAAYTATSDEDLQSALDMLANKTGADRFAILGLCSGAYAAMKFAAKSERIDKLILINQLVYYVTHRELADLSSGAIETAQVLDFPRSTGIISRATRALLRASGKYGALLGQALQFQLVGGRLGAKLSRLSSKGIRLSFIQSENDPSEDALLLPARRSVARLLRSDAIERVTIPGADHTFSAAGSQDQLFKCVEQVLGDRRRR